MESLCVIWVNQPFYDPFSFETQFILRAWWTVSSSLLQSHQTVWCSGCSFSSVLYSNQWREFTQLNHSLRQSQAHLLFYHIMPDSLPAWHPRPSIFCRYLHVMAPVLTLQQYFIHYFMREAGFSSGVRRAVSGGKHIAADHEERKLQRCI